MSQFVSGSFVLHAKLPELGSGEVLWSEKGTLRLRFACGERSFLADLASQHLSIVVAGPPPLLPAKARKRVRKAPAKPSTRES